MNILIIANGKPAPAALLERLCLRADCIIAADGGANICHAHGITPDYIVGDLDSIQLAKDQISEKTKLVHISEQETTDLQKALAFAEKLHPGHIEIGCCFGKRSDHALGNILLLHHSQTSAPLTMYDDTGSFRLLKPGSTSLNNLAGITISLFALERVTNITLEGFQFPLTHATVGPAFIGVSNKIIAQKASVTFNAGRILLYQKMLPTPKSKHDKQ